jgi:alpha/beta superfamily hydrolase
MSAPLQLVTDDGLTLEGELAAPPDANVRCGVVLCHPHPQYGGTMRSIVISALFESLPLRGATCLRFNFRGVEGGQGTYDGGNLERVDVEAAVRALAGQLPVDAPLLLTGWSFGADMALSVRAERVGAWMAIAPPLRFAHDLGSLAVDPRPKLLALAQHDEVRDPVEVQELAVPWANTEVHVVGGASHFFVGRTDRLVELASDFVDRIAPGA